MTTSSTPPVVIVGAGLAGLCCARRLYGAGVPFLLLEKGSSVGGRVRTDHLDGFLLDRGFQVLLDSYPEARRELDYRRLDLRPFGSGALVYRGSKFHRVSDPFRQPLQAIPAAFSPVGSFADKLRVAALRTDVRRGAAQRLFDRAEATTLESLQRRGFSPRMIDEFFRPFFGGVFLERNLDTSSRWFELLFRLFSEGSACLPANGMQAIPQQLAEDLPQGSVRLDTSVRSATAEGVTLDDGTRLAARAVVIAADQPSAKSLLPQTEVRQGVPEASWRSVRCLYYQAPSPPTQEHLLVLNGEGGVINNLCVPSVVAPNYAPDGQHLVSVTSLDDRLDSGELERAVRRQLEQWFGRGVQDWAHLRTYDIEHAQPAQGVGDFDPHRPQKTAEGVLLCGDYLETSSIHGAMVSGRKAAEAVLGRSRAAGSAA